MCQQLAFMDTFFGAGTVENIKCHVNNLEAKLSVMESATANDVMELIESNEGISMSQQPSSSNPAADIEEKGDGESDSTQIVRRVRMRKAACWTWFTLIEAKGNSDGKPKVRCKICLQLFNADPRKNGTSSLNHHMKKCPKHDNKDINQMLMEKMEGMLALRDLKIDGDVVREMILTLVVKHELPLNIVEYEAFRKLLLHLYPHYNPISRGTLLNYIRKMFKKEKTSIREAMNNAAGRISLTIDLWTSISNVGYMSITSHYIDRNWILHKRLIKFTVLSPSHTGASIALHL